MHRKRFILMACTVIAATTSGLAGAQHLDPQAQYRQDLLRCEQEQSVVDIEACKKEAEAALQAARTNTLGNGAGTDYQANERARCMALPEGQRADCLLLISGENTRVRGSVSQGGVLRETTIIIPAPEPVAPATPPTPLIPEAAVPSPVRP
ncbi:MAG: hypothetical protein WCY47_00765 [Pusillimonas sp.]